MACDLGPVADGPGKHLGGSTAVSRARATVAPSARRRREVSQRELSAPILARARRRARAVGDDLRKAVSPPTSRSRRALPGASRTAALPRRASRASRFAPGRRCRDHQDVATVRLEVAHHPLDEPTRSRPGSRWARNLQRRMVEHPRHPAHRGRRNSSADHQLSSPRAVRADGGEGGPIRTPGILVDEQVLGDTGERWPPSTGTSAMRCSRTTEPMTPVSRAAGPSGPSASAAPSR